MKTFFRSAITLFSILLLAATGSVAQNSKPAVAAPRGGQPNPTERESRAGSRIKGRVITEGGRPVPDATIMVFPVNVVGNMQTAVASLLRPISTDADGIFELTALQPGAYTISANSPGFVLSEQDSKQFYRPGDEAILNLVKGGVITGKVTNSSGEPVVGALIRAIKTREADQSPSRIRTGVGAHLSDSLAFLLGPYRTDDRGIYRIYGLAPGYYQVAAGGKSAQGLSLGNTNAYDADAPTYYPSGTIETAEDVLVPAGAEATGIDIRYRENHGHSIGGTISVSGGPSPQVISVLLTRASGITEATSVVMAGRDHFGFDSVLDGEYLITAIASSGNPALAGGADNINASASQVRPVTVRGADVTGINLTIEPLAGISGRTVLEVIQDKSQKPACKEIRTVPLEGTVLSARDERRDNSVDPMNGPLGGFNATTPNDKGEFSISLLRPGVQRLEVQLPAEHLYLRSLLLRQADPNAKSIDVAKNGVRLKSGDKVKGVVVTIAEGAVAFSGKVVVEPDKKPPTSKMRVHFVPAEPEASDDVLRYYEGPVSADGSFSLTNLAPGKYWIVGRESDDAKQAEADRKPSAWEPGARTALRFEGEASKNVIELTQCQKVADYRFSYVPLTKETKQPLKKSQ
jgi:protocatechuate 3,4-dioxygenase beta subunit